MINEAALQSIFYQSKPYIIDEIVKYYGEEYRSIITERLNGAILIFSSDPFDDLEYIYDRDDVKDDIKASVMKRKIDYDRYKNDFEKVLADRFRSFIRMQKTDNHTFTDFSSMPNLSFDIFSSIFCDGEKNPLFSKGKIDSFSSKSLSILKNSCYENKKNEILNNQNFCKRAFPFNWDNLDPLVVDKILEYRKQLYEEYINKLLKTEYAVQIKKLMNGVDKYISCDSLFSFIFLSYEKCGQTTFFHTEHGNFELMRFPITRIKSWNNTEVDITIIHELIHCIERHDNFVGLDNVETCTRTILNEIRTQKVARRITNNLHEHGIFIFDNPNSIENNCAYEKLFPIAEFLDEYENELKHLAITGDSDSIYEIFDDNFTIYNHNLNKLWQQCYENNDYNLDNETICVFQALSPKIVINKVKTKMF